MPTGTACITTFSRGAEVQPVAFVTVNEYVPGDKPETGACVPVPEVLLPGVIVKVHVPDDGSPPISTLPAGVVHVGWTIVPAVGVEGVTGATFIVMPVEAGDVHPEELVMV